MTELYTEITQDRTGVRGRLLDVISMGDIFLQRYPNPGEDHTQYPKIPIDLVFNGSSYLLQNKQTVSVKALYGDEYWYESGLNETMVQHLRSVVRFACSFVELDPKDNVIDIASNDGTLLHQYKKVSRGANTVGYDPAKSLQKGAEEKENHHFVMCFSGDHYLFRFRPAKIITACAVIYHIPDPIPFFKDVVRCLDDQGVFVFEFTYLPFMMRNNAVDSIGHEHTTHLSLSSLEPMLKAAGLELISALIQDTNAGTLLCAAMKKPSFYYDTDALAFVQGLREYEWQAGITRFETYQGWAKRCEEVKAELIVLLYDFAVQGKSVYLYGASTKVSILLQWLEHDMVRPINEIITKAVERNPKKVGKEMVGLKIPIISEEEARRDNPDVMFVGPWSFKDAFIERERDYLENGGTMVFPLPTLDVVRA